MNTTTTTTGPVTLDDVRSALEVMGVAASATNASAIRREIGRGSLSTIQKHLEVLRAAEIEEEAPGINGVIPEPDEAAVTALWRAAYAAVEGRVYRAMAEAQAEVLKLREALAAAQADAVALAEAADAAAERAAAAEARAERVEQDLLEEKRAAELTAKTSADEVSELRDMVERVRAEGAAELERERLKWDAERAALQASLERAEARTAEALALLHQLRGAT